ncbi:MAG: hypothetical protein ACI9MJ_000666 [Alphaproteobacteria bacterium]|jgi:hypothetical protein
MLRDIPRNPLLLQVLSLYLLLLAFFVVLNTISRVEDGRRQAVSGSLSETFASVGIPSDRTIRFTSNEGELLGDAAYLQRLGSLIKTEFSIAKVTQTTAGRLLEVTFSLNELFVSDANVIAPERRPLIDNVAAALRTVRPEWRYDVEILVGADPGNALAMARAASLAKLFVAAGIQKRRILAGLVRGDPGNLRLRFHVRSRKGESTWFPGETQQ